MGHREREEVGQRTKERLSNTERDADWDKEIGKVKTVMG